MQEFLTQILANNPVLAPAIFIVLRPLSIIIPPIPGAVFDIAGLLAFGWLWGFIYAEIGIMLGAMSAFWLARYFREPVVKKFASLEKIEEWEKKLSDSQKFWGFAGLRFFTNSLFDYISYAAGLTRMRTSQFFFASLIGNAPGLFLFYYVGGYFYRSNLYYLIVFIATIAVLGAVLTRKEKLLDDAESLFKSPE